YELSLFMVVSVVFTMIIAGAAWLPLILTAIELMARRQPALGGHPATLPWLTLGAAALGFQILAGHVEVTYYTLLIAGAYSAWRLVGLWLSHRKDRKGHKAETENQTISAPDAPGRPFQGIAIQILQRASALAALFFLGLLLGAIQLMPLYELVRNNFRSGSATFDQIMGWAYPWRHAIAFLIPNFYGNPSHHGYFDLFTWRWSPAPLNNATIDWGIKNYVEGGAYVGLLPLLLSAIVMSNWVISKWRKQPITNYQLPTSQSVIPFFALLAFFALAFAFPTRLYALIFWLPGINQLHSPFRWVWPLSLSVAVLSAYGIETLWRSRLPQSPYGYHVRRKATPGSVYRLSRIAAPFFLWSEPSLITFFSGLAVWGGTITILMLVAGRIWYARLAGLMDRLVLGAGPDPASDPLRLAKASEAFTDGRMFFSYEARWILIFGLLLIASGIVLRLSRCPIYFRGRSVWEPLALGVIVLDLTAAGWGFNPAADPAILSYVPPSVAF
ncbi:MAG: hypothetical protein ACRDH2_16250, partial [Anaerolineales bacterium]